VAVRSSGTTHLLRCLAVFGLAIVLIGCLPSTSASPSSASGSLPPSAKGAPTSSICRDIEISLPNGDRLAVTGTWLGNDASYWIFTQIGDCVWGTASDMYGFLDGSHVYWQIYLRGTMLPDFTIPIEYAYSPFSDFSGGGVAHYGQAVLSIEFGTADGPMTLRKTAGTTCEEDDPCPPGVGTLQTTAWTLVSARIIIPPPTPEP
jgi:hypothetical protein